MARHLATILLSKEAIKDTATKAHQEEDIILRGTWDRQVDPEVLTLQVPEVRPGLVDRPEDPEAIPRMTLAMAPRLAREGRLCLGLLHHKMSRSKLRIMTRLAEYFVTYLLSLVY